MFEYRRVWWNSPWNSHERAWFGGTHGYRHFRKPPNCVLRTSNCGWSFTSNGARPPREHGRRLHVLRLPLHMWPHLKRRRRATWKHLSLSKMGDNHKTRVCCCLIVLLIRKKKYKNWLVVWNMNFIFLLSWECHHPNWLIFFRGVGSTTNQKSSFPLNHQIYLPLPAPAHLATQKRPQTCSSGT